MIDYTRAETPLGTITLAARDDRLIGAWFEGQKYFPVIDANWRHSPGHPLLSRATQQLQDYFQGRHSEFDLPIAFHGTDFQKRVWQSLLDIPHGETRTYGELARRLGNPSAMRAVGAAVGRNPLSVIVPCHRVLGAKGSLTGYAGGVERKSRLLFLEQKERL